MASFLSFFSEKPAMILMDREFSPEQLSSKKALDLRNINASAWKAILSQCVAVDLSLYHVTVTSLEGIDRLQRTLCVPFESQRPYDILQIRTQPACVPGEAAQSPTTTTHHSIL